MPSRMHTLHIRLGVVEIRLRTCVRRLLREYRQLYAPFLCSEELAEPIEVDVRPAGGFLGFKRRFEIRINDRLQFQPSRYEEVLPYLEWGVNWEHPRISPRFLHLHAAALERDGQGVVFAGDSGHGKSTLAVGLVARGWKYLCDEFAIVHAESLELQPFPRAICVKQASNPVLDSLGLAHLRRTRYLKGSKGYVGFVNPLAIRSDSIGRTCPVRHLVFPRYSATAEPELTPISRAQAAFDLHRVCFNLFGCQRPAIDVLTRLVRGAQTYRLVSGQITATCELLSRRLDFSRADSSYARTG